MPKKSQINEYNDLFSHFDRIGPSLVLLLQRILQFLNSDMLDLDHILLATPHQQNNGSLQGIHKLI